MKRLVALYRCPAYSPNLHLQNDRAILDAVVERLAGRGWCVAHASEAGVAAGQLPSGDLYLNMCQGAEASDRLREMLPAGARCINTPSAVLACHRHHLIPRLHRSGVPFPATVLVATSGPVRDERTVAVSGRNGDPIWVKRGDVHAQSAADVAAVPASELGAALARFAERGIGRVALQRHVPGPVVKFYGVAGGQFFHSYRADAPDRTAPRADAEGLRVLAERAARALGLAVYGGDAVLSAPDAPVLIDLNDWPSFAPVRAAAAAAIARYAHRYALKDRYSCSTP